MDEAFVAAQAIVLDSLRASRRHSDWLFKILEREGDAVIPAVFRFPYVFGYEIVGQMAFDAGRDCVVAGLLPGVVLALHDMTIDAGARVGAQVGESFSIDERFDAESDQNPQGSNADDSQQTHPEFLDSLLGLVGNSFGRAGANRDSPGKKPGPT